MTTFAREQNPSLGAMTAQQTLAKIFNLNVDAGGSYTVNIRPDAPSPPTQQEHDSVTPESLTNVFSAPPKTDHLNGLDCPQKDLLDFIGKHETIDGAEGYNIVYSGAQSHFKEYSNKLGKDLSEMSINEVMEWQKDTIRWQREKGIPASSRSSAAGRYQFNYRTLQETMDKLDLTGDELFDAKMQDRLTLQLVKDCGYSKFMTGQMSENRFMYNLAGRWASLPTASGNGRYDGLGTNEARTGPSAFRNVLDELKSFGGAAVGTLHNIDNYISGAVDNFTDWLGQKFEDINPF